MSYRLAPGHILQFNHLKRRLKGGSNFTFIEIGAGNGMVSHELLKLGMKGIAFDLNKSACENNCELNSDFIKSGSYKVVNADFILSEEVPRADVIISCMVLEHLPDAILNAFFEKCKINLKPTGRLITFVPASPWHWGIEDEIAGHLKRYTREDFFLLSKRHGFKSVFTTGLCYPLSNILLRVSNFLVERAEKYKLNLTEQDRTIQSGNREVAMKTVYPNFFRYLINDFTLFPFILLQRLFCNHRSCLVLYNEMILKD